MKTKILTNLKKFEWLIQIGLFLLFLYLIAIFTFSTNSDAYKVVFFERVGQLEVFYSSHEVLATAVILVAHLLVSFFSIPACAFINVGAGYLLGFWKGTALIYSVTMLSAVLGYFAGSFIYGKGGSLRLLPGFTRGIKAIENRGLVYMVLLRLSPFLPFGLLNLSLGYSRVGFSAFIFSTFVGIFFDVVLLNKIGSSIREMKSTSLDDYLVITGFFVALFLFVIFVFSKKAVARAHEI